MRAFARKRPVRKAWPKDVERARIVIEAPTACACCGGSRLSKLGEDVTETLEDIPRRFKVIETVREKFTCRDCEAISQAPAPFHATPARLHRPSVAGDDRVRQVRAAHPAEPPEHAVQM
ncbi:transposase [Rhizobium leguminosarum]|uniref:Transposase n=2 Tax=Rhizobium TaxID=379 RepID=A0A7W6ZN08_RHIET|nr:IS66 family insertion sequence transposase protein [Rhizobium sp. Kim5]EJZ17831.1 insertion sequence transposase [Rhizobium sp. Pop5]MBB4332732.1 transposase [Rhizobium leguminosarum]MBB4483280.1 transposase [Rhizobium etli]OHV22717.1 transposase [Rhizobium sp. RSm-3]